MTTLSCPVYLATDGACEEVQLMMKKHLPQKRKRIIAAFEWDCIVTLSEPPIECCSSTLHPTLFLQRSIITFGDWTNHGSSYPPHHTLASLHLFTIPSSLQWQKPSDELSISPLLLGQDVLDEQLLDHARIYNLAGKLDLPICQSISHIHNTPSCQPLKQGGIRPPRSLYEVCSEPSG